MRNEGAARTPVTIVCVYNDPDVLAQCLARSVAEGRADAPATEFIPVDNRGNRFRSAGAALNHAATQASNEVIVFVHQDVILHSLVALERAATALMSDPTIKILGATGMDAGDGLVGRIRDRVVRAGRPAPTPVDVDSVDEVLFLIRRRDAAMDPLNDHALLAWHAYGVEYCARVRDQGYRAAVVDIPLTHNSLTTNLSGLDLAHAHVGKQYPHLLPIRTTCGTIWRERKPQGLRRIRHYTRRAQVYWSESTTARALSRQAPSSTIIIADIRMVIDAMLEMGGLSSLQVIDLDTDDPAAAALTQLVRFGRAYSTSVASADQVLPMIADRHPDELLLFTTRTHSVIGKLRMPPAVPHVIGHTHDTGIWLAVGVPPATLQPLWSTRRNRAFAGLIDTSGDAKNASASVAA